MFIEQFRRSDPYYWVTAQVSARGWQVSGRLRRMLAIGGIIVAVCHVALILSRAGAVDPSQVAASAFLTSCGVLMSVFWLRVRRWPTRRMSYLAMVVGAVCTTVATLSIGDPILGMFGAAVFTLLTAYAAVFHHTAALAIGACGFVVSVTVLGSRLSETNLIAFVVLVVFLLLFNGAVYVTARTAAHLTLIDGGFDEFDRLTGLPNRRAFDAQLSTLIGARCRTRDRYLAVGVLKIDGYGALEALTGRPGIHAAQMDVSEALRETLRRDAIAAHVGDDEFAIADVFEADDPSPLMERVSSAIASAPSRITVSAGVACRPLRAVAGHPHENVIEALMCLAGSANGRSRQAGGNVVTYDIADVLTLPRSADS